jgi:DNA replication licensing factor MCM2
VFAEDEGEHRRGRQRRRVGDEYEEIFDEDEEDFEERVEDIEDVKGKLSEWLKHSNVRKEVQRRFKRFLRSFDPAPREAGERGGRSRKAYSAAMQHMVIYNEQSLDIDFQHLTNDEKTMQIAIWIADCPREMLDILNQALREEVLRRFPHNDEIKEELFVRVHNLPVTDSLRELRQSHLNVFVQVSGVVTRRGGVYPQLGIVKYDCQKCGYTLGPFTHSQDEELRVSSCPQCQSGGPFSVNQEETTYRNYQKLTLQESPSAVPAGRLPRQKDIVLLNDLIDSARPGDEVIVTGIFTNNFSDSLNTKDGFPVFSTLIEAVHIKKQTDLVGATASKLAEEDKREIKECVLPSTLLLLVG